MVHGEAEIFIKLGGTSMEYFGSEHAEGGLS